MQISKLDATKLSQETTIKELKANITSLQSKLNKMESEHDDLGKKFSSHTMQTDSKIKHLQQVRLHFPCFLYRLWPCIALNRLKKALTFIDELTLLFTEKSEIKIKKLSNPQLMLGHS